MNILVNLNIREYVVYKELETVRASGKGMQNSRGREMGWTCPESRREVFRG